MINLKKLDTEQINQNTVSIDSMDTQDILKAINAEDKTIAYTIEGILPDIEKAVECAYNCLKSGGRLIYIGAGTSGRLGVLDASECPPTFGVSKEMIQGLIAGGDQALRIAKEGAEDDENLAAQDLKAIDLTQNDCVCGLAASGRTPYVLGGLNYANSIGAKTISVCCVKNGSISELSQHPIEAIVGPEVVTGSTRMKAGTAQKLILNMISTTCMIKMGKVYGNLMVDVRPTNLKLIERAKQILVTVTSCSYEEASHYLEKSENDVKIAILMIILNEDKEQVKELLLQNGNNVSKVIRHYKEGK